MTLDDLIKNKKDLRILSLNIKSNYEYLKILRNNTTFLDKYKLEKEISQRLYHYINKIYFIPKCQCGKYKKFIKIHRGYRNTCGDKTCIKNEREKIFQNKYGVKNPSQSQEIKKKKQEICLKKYGYITPLLNKNVIEKIKQTNLKNYGFENVAKSSIIKKRISDTLKKKIKYYEEKYDGLNIIERKDENFFIKCDKCEKIYEINYQTLHKRYNEKKTCCTKCNTLNQKSRSYLEIEFLNDIKNITSLCVIPNDRLLLKNYELDIYIPEKKLGIEIHGIYYHTEKFVDKNYHINKMMCSEKNGITLIQFFEDEIIQKKEICLSIINEKINGANNNVYGRKCEIKLIPQKECNNFLEENHIQGKINGSIRIGLFYNNEIVSLCVFSKNRVALGGKSSNNSYELLRYCNKKYTSVYGGFSKLLKYFIKNYNPLSITTYSDRRLFTGSVYLKFGFKFIKNTPINYYYIEKGKRRHRYSYRKSELIKHGYDKNKSEHEIMLERGMYRIYDCGNLKYVWEDKNS